MSEEQEGIRDHRTDCNLFGTGFSWDEPQCKKCDRVGACKVKSDREAHQISHGIQPKIPVNTKPKWPKPSPFLYASKPKITSDSVSINIRFKKWWLRKMLGEQQNVEDMKKLFVDFVFKIREKIRKQFANRPEIIAELDELLGGF